MTTYIRRFDPPLCAPHPRGSALAGMRFSVKDLFMIEGVPVSGGVRPDIIERSDRTAAVVARLLDEGAILTGCTNLDPLGADMRGENPFFGTVENPACKNAPCLGSSAGAAASIIEDDLDFALCTDSGGSARAPAASTGLFALKATSDLFPRDGALLTHPVVDCIGLLSRSVEVIRKVVSLFDCTADSEPDAAVIIVPDDQAGAVMESDVAAEFEECLATLSAVFRIERGLPARLLEGCCALRKPLLAGSISQYARNLEQPVPLLAALSAYAASLPKDELGHAERALHDLRHGARSIFGNCMFITPALPRDSSAFEGEVPLNFFLCFSNILDLPSVNIPVGSGYFSLHAAFMNKSNFSALTKTSQLRTLLA